jgi:hypothetical protein
MTEGHFRKMSEELFTCDLIKDDMEKDHDCVDATFAIDSEKKWWFFVSGLLIGFVARGTR